MKKLRLIALLAGVSALSACNLAPNYVRNVSSFVPAQWPNGAAYPPASDTQAGMTWKQLIADEKLRRIIEQALTNNQDLAAAVANVAAAHAQYRAQRSNLLPTLTGNAGASINRSPAGGASAGSKQNFTANIGFSGFELDLFGRQKNLSREAFARYLASDSGRRATKLSVISETASAYLALAADQDLLAIAREQVSSGERTVSLTEKLHSNGLVSGADMANAQTILQQAKADVESYTTLVAQDRNALQLLVGQPIADADLPGSLISLDDKIAVTPAGLSSSILLNRPDVVEAEQQLKAANFDIGAARAAFFPTISLTSAIGFASTALTKLFTASGSIWSASGNADIPLIGGATGANLEYSKAQRDYYLATYRKTAQTAYRDVADALARRGTIDNQREAQTSLVLAAGKSYEISTARYRNGIDSFLTTLVAQRTYYAAQQAEKVTILADLTNRIALYSALGADSSL